jgi:hypothetical protein
LPTRCRPPRAKCDHRRARTLDIALSAVGSARAVAGERRHRFSWADVERFAAAAERRPVVVLTRLRDAGSKALAECALDTLAIAAARSSAGQGRVRARAAAPAKPHAGRPRGVLAASARCSSASTSSSRSTRCRCR